MKDCKTCIYYGKCTTDDTASCVHTYENNTEYSNYKPEMALVVHGHWEQQDRTGKMYYGPNDYGRPVVFDGYCCSECNKWNLARTNYCPNCGAKMDLES